MAIPIRELSRQFRNGTRMFDGRLVGCTPDYAEVTRLDVGHGRFITDADLINERTTASLAAEAAARLFPFEDPIGQKILVEEHSTSSSA